MLLQKINIGTKILFLVSIFLVSCGKDFGKLPPEYFGVYLESDSIKEVKITYDNASGVRNNVNNSTSKIVTLPYNNGFNAYEKSTTGGVSFKVSSIDGKELKNIKGFVYHPLLDYDTICKVLEIMNKNNLDTSSLCYKVAYNQVFNYLDKINYPCIIDASKNKLEVNLNDWKGQ